HGKAAGSGAVVGRPLHGFFGVAKGQVVVAAVVLRPRRHLEAVAAGGPGIGAGPGQVPVRDADLGPLDAHRGPVGQLDSTIEEALGLLDVEAAGGDARRLNEGGGGAVDV